MAKYIDADRLIRRLENRTYRAKGKFIEMINEQEAADVQEVRHGRWEQSNQDRWRCSVCKVGNNYAYSWDVDTKGYTKLQDNYCPNCGARMDEVEE